MASASPFLLHALAFFTRTNTTHQFVLFPMLLFPLPLLFPIFLSRSYKVNVISSTAGSLDVDIVSKLGNPHPRNNGVASLSAALLAL
jgi:hypothetical protein